jgi:hypothetical protein
LDYLTGLMNLYYDNGLRCWWAPLFQFANDIMNWSSQEILTSPKVDLQITPDGVFGPIFPRSIESSIKKQPDQVTHSSYRFPEYLLISQSAKELRKDVGTMFTSDFQEIMRQWGYYRNNYWKENDFLFLFERLHLKKSIQVIAESYIVDISTVQRNTSKLANILFLELPEAPHKFR